MRKNSPGPYNPRQNQNTALTVTLSVAPAAFHINHHSLPIPIGYRIIKSEYLNHLNPRVIESTPPSNPTKYPYLTTSATAQAKSIAPYAGEVAVTLGKA
jgi:hypothetical protein